MFPFRVRCHVDVLMPVRVESVLRNVRDTIGAYTVFS